MKQKQKSAKRVVTKGKAMTVYTPWQLPFSFGCLQKCECVREKRIETIPSMLFNRKKGKTERKQNFSAPPSGVGRGRIVKQHHLRNSR